jgi:hypothetical protein
MTISAYGWTNGQGGTHHYRIAEPLRALALNGFYTDMGEVMDGRIQSTYDIILAHMPHSETAVKVWRSLHAAGHNKLIVDIDDYAWGYPTGSGSEGYWTPANLSGLEECLSLADEVTTPSEALADYVSRFNGNVSVLPNTVPLTVTQIMRKTDYRHFRIGFQGASQHKLDMTLDILNVLASFMLLNPQAELHLFGFTADSVYLPAQLQSRVKVVPWQHNLNAYYNSLQFDVGIGPLADNTFNLYKSDIRFREYCAVGARPILANCGPYVDTPFTFDTPMGFMAQLERAFAAWKRPRQWGEEIRQRRKYAREHFTTEHNAGKVADVYRRVNARDLRDND